LKSFERFLSHLATIPDPRRAEGKLYQLPHVLLFSILAIVSGANSYRGIRTFIKVHRRKLNKAFKICWKRPPAHTAIRYILQGLTAADVEIAFREHAAHLNVDAAGPGARVIAFDGKALKGSPEKLLNLRYRLNPSGDVILIFSPHRPLPSPLLRPLVINQARFAEMRF
jgi:hypothetical protein